MKSLRLLNAEISSLRRMDRQTNVMSEQKCTKNNLSHGFGMVKHTLLIFVKSENNYSLTYYIFLETIIGMSVTLI